MNITVFDEEVFYCDIFSKFVEVSRDKKAVFLWKSKELAKLMELLEDRKNISFAMSAINFILALNESDGLDGVNFRSLNALKRKNILKSVKNEFPLKIREIKSLSLKKEHGKER